MRFLWIAKDFPNIPDTGALLYTNGLLRSFVDAGATGNLLTYGSDTGVFAGGFGIKVRAVALPRRNRVFSLLSSQQSDAWRLKSSLFLQALDEELAENPGVIVIDYFAMGWALPHLLTRFHQMRVKPKLVYVSHNYERAVRKAVALSASGLVMRYVMALDAFKAGKLEDRLVAAADIVTTITDEDRQLYLRNAPKKTVLTLKPAFNGEIKPTSPITAETPRRVVLVGSFEWAAKQFILRRFLDAAEQPFQQASIELLVVGKIPDAFRGEMAAKHKTVRFTGRVADVRPFIRGGRIGLMPDDVGGGFKLKILDYVFDGLAVATIASQAAGLPLQPGVDMITGETIPELVGRIVGAIDDVARLDAMRRSAWAACANQFDWKSRGQALKSALS